MDFERFDRATALSKAGRLEDALREFVTLAAQSSDDDEERLAILYQANCLLHLNRVVEARQLWSEATARQSSPYSEVLDAKLCVVEGNREDAVRKLRDFLDVHEDLRSEGEWSAYAGAQDELGRLLFELERYEEAIKPLEGSLAAGGAGEGRQICFYLGVCHLMNERWKDAEKRLLESLPPDCTDSWWVQAQYYLGRLYYNTGEYSKAKRSLEMCRNFMDQSDGAFKGKVLEWLAKIP